MSDNKPSTDAEKTQPDQGQPDTELLWLRHFYKKARHAMGPADSDIYRSIASDYKQAGNILPKETEESLFGDG